MYHVRAKQGSPEWSFIKFPLLQLTKFLLQSSPIPRHFKLYPLQFSSQLNFLHLPLFLQNSQSVQSMAHVDQGWWWHRSHLQNPLSNEGDRTSLGVAHSSAARLFCITEEARLRIIPDIFSCYTQNKHTKYEQGDEPDLSNHGGVDLNFLQNASKEIPVPHACLVHHLSSEPHQLRGIKSSILTACYCLKQTCGQNMNKASRYRCASCLTFSLESCDNLLPRIYFRISGYKFTYI